MKQRTDSAKHFKTFTKFKFCLKALRKTKVSAVLKLFGANDICIIFCHVQYQQLWWDLNSTTFRWCEEKSEMLSLFFSCQKEDMFTSPEKVLKSWWQHRHHSPVDSCGTISQFPLSECGSSPTSANIQNMQSSIDSCATILGTQQHTSSSIKINNGRDWAKPWCTHTHTHV